MLKFLNNRDCSLQPETLNLLLERTKTKSPFVGLVFDSILIKSKKRHRKDVRLDRRPRDLIRD